MKGLKKKLSVQHGECDRGKGKNRDEVSIMNDKPLPTLSVHMPEFEDICEDCNGVYREGDGREENRSQICQPTYWKNGVCHDFLFFPPDSEMTAAGSTCHNPHSYDALELLQLKPSFPHKITNLKTRLKNKDQFQDQCRLQRKSLKHFEILLHELVEPELETRSVPCVPMLLRESLRISHLKDLCLKALNNLDTMSDLKSLTSHEEQKTKERFFHIATTLNQNTTHILLGAVQGYILNPVGKYGDSSLNVICRSLKRIAEGMTEKLRALKNDLSRTDNIYVYRIKLFISMIDRLRILLEEIIAASALIYFDKSPCKDDRISPKKGVRKYGDNTSNIYPCRSSSLIRDLDKSVKEIEKFATEVYNAEYAIALKSDLPSEVTIMQPFDELYKNQIQLCRELLSALRWYEEKGPSFILLLMATVAEAAEIADSMDVGVPYGRIMEHNVPERKGLKFVHYSTTDVNRRSWLDTRGRYINRI